MPRTTRPTALALCLVALAAVRSPLARAQKAATSPATSPVAPSASVAASPPAPSPAPLPVPAPMPDIVRLRDGSFVRGTILEHGVGSRTVIETRTGSRAFEAGEVVYAGLASRDPGAVPAGEVSSTPPLASGTPAPSAPASQIDKQVHFRADGDRVQFHAIALGRNAIRNTKLEPLCVAPCDLTLDRGAYRLALGWEGQPPMYTRENIELKEGATVQGRVLSRKRTRAVGWSIMGLSTVPIVYGLVRGLTAAKGADRGVGLVVAVVGAGTMGAGFVITRAKDIAEAELVEEKASKTARGPARQTVEPLVLGVGGQF